MLFLNTHLQLSQSSATFNLLSLLLKHGARVQKLIILDRDGVINEDSDNYVCSVDQWVPIPGSIEAIASLFQAGFQIAVATNQSGLHRGYFTMHDLEAMHKKMTSLVVAQGARLNSICFCPHGPADDCQCRKPRPGMLNNIIRKTNAKPSKTWAVGDSLRDLQAGQSAGCRIALVLTGKGMKTQSILNKDSSCVDLAGVEDLPVFENLANFATQLISEGV